MKIIASEIDKRIKVYGDLNHRDKKCKIERKEQETIVNQVRKKYPDLVFTSVKNESKRNRDQVDNDKAMGLLSGVSDLVFFGNPTLCLEVKRKDHTTSEWQPMQQPFLIQASKQGAMACVCFGWEAGMQAIEDWLKITLANNKDE